MTFNTKNIIFYKTSELVTKYQNMIILAKNSQDS